MNGRLAGWTSFVLILAALGYAGHFAGGPPDRNVLYHYSTFGVDLVQLAIELGVVAWIAVGLSKRRAFALRRPSSWRRAAGLAVGVLVAVSILSQIVAQFGNPGKEQGLTPAHWESRHAGAYALNFVALALLTPIVEELVFRGIGFTLLERYGQAAAIVLVGIAFGLAHGLVLGFPILVAFGSGLAYLRSRTGSVYPGMLLHGTFNAIALVVAVTT